MTTVMKNLFLFLVLTGLAAAQNPYMKSASNGKIKQSVMFDGKMFVLKFVDHNKLVDLNEYYLREEEPNTWTRMVSVALYKTSGSPGAMAKNMEQSLLKEHPEAPHELMTSPDGSQALFMCVNWAGDRKTGSEFDVYRLQKNPQGVLTYQVSLRPYQAKISTEEYKALKDRWAQQIQTGKFPDVAMQLP